MPLKQDSRLLAMSTALGPDVLAVRSVSIQEHLSQLFHIEAELRSEGGEIDLDKVLGQDATIRLETGQTDPRYFNGYVSRIVQVANVGRYAHYRATVVPWLWFLTRSADCRIFQDKTAPEIIEAVFKDKGFDDYVLKLSVTYPKREYCVQYRETDFNFVSRLMEQEGIYYFFQHDNGKHKLVLADSISAHSPEAGYNEITFHELEAGQERQVITNWEMEKQVQPIACSLNDFDFTKPKTSLAVSSNVTRNHGGAVYEIYDYPGEYSEHGDGERLAGARLDEFQAQYELLHGQASARGLAAGNTFTLKSHPRSDQNRDYLITGVSLRVSSGEYASGGADEDDEFFSCSFSAIPKTQQFRPPRQTPKPVVQGPQTAIVVGKGGEEIDTDEHGRVKLLFHWDRYSKADEKSSCWVRVSQAVAGKGWGALYLPRVGQEVIVEFLEGDPDRPIVTGRVYNGETTPPYSLPDKKTISTLKTNSSKGGGGFNEIRFDDKKGSEQIFVHAEKDKEIRVKNDTKEFIGNEHHLIVKKNQFENVEGVKNAVIKKDRLIKIEGDLGEKIKGDHHTAVDGVNHLTVKGERRTKVTGDESFKTEGDWKTEASKGFSLKSGKDFQCKSGGNYAMDADQNIHIKAGQVMVLEAGTQLSIKVGGNFIDISSSGVSIKGTLVNINSGGAAGSGSGSSPVAPDAPEDPDPPTDAKEAVDDKAGTVEDPPQAPQPPKPQTYSASAEVLKAAAADGTPFCEKCEEAKKAAAAAEADGS